MVIDIMNDHDLEQLTLGCISQHERKIHCLSLTSLPGQFQKIHFPEKLGDHDVVSGTLTVNTHQKEKRKERKEDARMNVYLYQKGDFESMRTDSSDFAKDRYFSGYSDNSYVQDNFDLITSFIQESADKHIPEGRYLRSLGLPHETRRKLRRRNKNHA